MSRIKYAYPAYVTFDIHLCYIFKYYDDICDIWYSFMLYFQILWRHMWHLMFIYAIFSNTITMKIRICLIQNWKTTWNQFGWKKTSHFVASWYRPPGSTSDKIQLLREQLDYIRTHHKDKMLPSVHVLGDFNFKDIDWPDRLRNQWLV